MILSFVDICSLSPWSDLILSVMMRMMAFRLILAALLVLKALKLVVSTNCLSLFRRFNTVVISPMLSLLPQLELSCSSRSDIYVFSISPVSNDSKPKPCIRLCHRSLRLTRTLFLCLLYTVLTIHTLTKVYCYYSSVYPT